MTIIYQGFGLLASSLVVLFLYKVTYARKKFSNLPKPPDTLVFGHWFLLLREWMSSPKDMFPAYILDGVRRKFDLPPIFFLDLCPMFPPVVVISDPKIARKITLQDRAPRCPGVFQPLKPAATRRWIETLSRDNWVKNHALFGVSFTAAHFVRMIPRMSEDLGPMVQMLVQYSQTGQVFKMEKMAKLAILEMTGRAIFARQLGTFADHSEWSAAYDGAVSFISAARNPFKRPFIMGKWRKRCQVFHALIREEICACFREQTSKVRPKPSLLHSSFKAYLGDKLPQFLSSPCQNGEMSEEYVQELVSSCAGAFLAAVSGSAALSYCLMLLHQHPNIARRVQAEHDDIFSSDRNITLQLLKTNPERLNQLVFTLAVVKETLRLFSMGVILRQPSSDTVISNDGQIYSLRDHIVVLFHTAMHRRPDLFPEPDKFDPDRFMPGSRPKVPSDAWRPFEKGRGNCTGQELALVQLKLVLLLVVREFDFELAYESRSSRGPDIYGGPAYVTLSGTGPGPAGGMPMRVVQRSELGPR
nr:AceR [Aspergillus alliaceus]